MSYLVQPVDWLAIAPPLVVACTALAVLLGDVLPPTRGRRGAVSSIAFGGLVAALLLLLPLRGTTRAVFCVLAEQGAQGAVGAGGAGGPQSCSYVADGTTLVFQALAAGGAAVVVLLSARGTLSERMPFGEYHFLLLMSACGAMTLAAARDLVTIVVALELVSLPAFALVALRGADRRAPEAALKFFLVSVVSVAVMLFGVSLVYGVTGSLHLDQVAYRLGSEQGGPTTRIVGVGIVLTLVGLAFKVGAVPFHFWVPDTYVGAPVPVAAYLSVVSKAAGLVGLVLVVGIGFPAYISVWAPIIAVLAALTMSLGNLVALRQRNAVRLLAWSSVAQAGYLLVPLGAVPPGGLARGAVTGVMAATVAYLLIYAIVNLGAFAIVALVAGPDGSAGRGGRLTGYRGLFWTDPVRAGALAFFLLALAGLPPGLVGLFGKVVVFQAAVDGGAGWLAVVMAVNVVIGLAYYLYWTALLFAPAGEESSRSVEADASRPPTQTPWPAAIAVGVTVALGVVLSVAPGVVLDVLSDLPSPL
jgi:NADH-quinone oxidoreductase subunit N